MRRTGSHVAFEWPRPTEMKAIQTSFNRLTEGEALRDNTVGGLDDRDDFFTIETNCSCDLKGSHRFGDVNPDRRISKMYPRAHSKRAHFSNDCAIKSCIPSSETEAEVLGILLGVGSHESVWVKAHGFFVDNGVVQKFPDVCDNLRGRKLE